jgi:hypothetical protein
MAVRQVVRIVRDYVQDNGVLLEQRYGPRAVTVAQDIKSLLAACLRDGSAYESLWSRFEVEPQTATGELIGALEALIEADPALVKRLNGFIEEFHRAIAQVGERLVGPRPVESPVGRDARGGYIPVGAMIALGDNKDVHVLFNQLQATVNERDDLEGPVKTELNEALRHVLAQVANRNARDTDALIRQLQVVQRLDMEIFEIVLDQLASLADDFGLSMADVIERLWNA